MPSKRKIIPLILTARSNLFLNFSVDYVIPLRSRKIIITLCTDKSLDDWIPQKLKPWKYFLLSPRASSALVGGPWIPGLNLNITGRDRYSLRCLGMVASLTWHCRIWLWLLAKHSFDPSYHTSDKSPWKAPVSLISSYSRLIRLLIWQRQALAGNNILLELLSLYLFWQVLLFMSRDIDCFSIYLK